MRIRPSAPSSLCAYLRMSEAIIGNCPRGAPAIRPGRCECALRRAAGRTAGTSRAALFPVRARTKDTPNWDWRRKGSSRQACLAKRRLPAVDKDTRAVWKPLAAKSRRNQRRHRMRNSTAMATALRTDRTCPTGLVSISHFPTTSLSEDRRMPSSIRSIPRKAGDWPTPRVREGPTGAFMWTDLRKKGAAQRRLARSPAEISRPNASRRGLTA